jgi:hypothetical protein
MNMKLHLIAASALLAITGAAHAASYNLGSLTPPDSAAGQSASFGAGAAISDHWMFELLAPADASALLSRTFAKPSGAITNFAASLSGGTLGAPVAFNLTPASTMQTLDWAGKLGAGDYTIHVSGLSAAAQTRYSVLVDVTPVPEPETYALMFAGLAAIGFVVRRRRDTQQA